MRTVIIALSVVFSLSLATAQDASYSGPLFDTHMHYSSPAWTAFSPDDVVAMMDKANVTNALVSSTPDDGTSTLLKRLPARVVAGLRPYRTQTEKRDWFKKPELLAYAKIRLAARRHIAFGEVILNYPDDLETPQMVEYLDIAAEQKLVLHLHTGANVVEALLERRPELTVLWAHAGFSEPPATIARLLDRFPTLFAELSYRAEEIMGGTDLEPEWRKLLIRHDDRFTVGSDTWQNDRWQFYQYLIDQHREWLGKLPKVTAEKIAFRNAQVLLRK